MVSESRRRAASDDAKPDVSWKEASDYVQGSVMADNSTGNKSAYSLVPPLRVPAVKTSTQSAYA